MPTKWSGEKVLSAISKRHRSGQKLSSDYMQKHERSLYQAACYRFGNWPKAIAAAGIAYDEVRVKVPTRKIVWSREIIIRTIQARHQAGEPLNSNHVQTHSKETRRLYQAAIKYFGSWQAGLTAAKVDYDLVRKKAPMRSWSKEAIVAEVVRRHEAGLTIRGAEVCLEDRGLYHAAKRYFGKNGWSKARVLAGFDPIDPRPWKIWDEETVTDEIRRLYENGIALNSGALRDGRYSYIQSAGQNVFGSWGRAVKAAGLDYSKIRKGRQPGWWTARRVVACIKLLERQGIRLSSKSIQLSRGGLFQAAIVHFDSWSQAVEAAGISYRKHCRIWSTKAWLRRMSSNEYQEKLQ